nr:immunoglobulin light chain junction region [Macaca mulatta]MOX11756.1 immunoglobulin light chain junction region [Macaca mulatta]MOX12047.1 immunoglobulin light chain junction region [Macaca mulatta]MOX12743.1 immunoglobulin light chain junction region [Macaca mulatta]MOX12969.1 immunoglobulin light chain junction region [Macaca mulatta]
DYYCQSSDDYIF